MRKLIFEMSISVDGYTNGPLLHSTGRDLDEATHATGYSFDVRRGFGSGAQAQAFQSPLADVARG